MEKGYFFPERCCWSSPVVTASARNTSTDTSYLP